MSADPFRKFEIDQREVLAHDMGNSDFIACLSAHKHCEIIIPMFAPEAKYRAWGHEYVTTSLLENAVILETIKKEGPSVGGHLTYPHSKAHVPCLSGRRPSSAVHQFGG